MASVMRNNQMSYLKPVKSLAEAKPIPFRSSGGAAPDHPGIIILCRSRLIAYFQMTKPSIMLLVLITAAAALIIEGTLAAFPGKFTLFFTGLFLSGGAANSLNQYFERDIDARMSRTRCRRPLPSGKIYPSEALILSIVLGISGVTILGMFFNWLTGILSLVTILFYSLFYTLYLKPTTPYNIVVGGIAGAMAPLGAWLAATGGIAVFPCLLTLIIILWTPPHFWALSLCFQDDYRASGYPMLPLVKGAEVTLKQIQYYAVALLPGSLAPLLAGSGWFYLIAAVFLGLIFIKKTNMARKEMTYESYWSIFKFSIFYLIALCAAMVIDRFL